MFYSVYTLPNNIRIIHHYENSPIVYCGFAVGVGSRNENEEQHGLAHFTEHMFFKGTKKRKSWHILNRLETVGGTLDAYTTKEETFVYSAIPTTYYERAVELLSDILFNSQFPQHEIDKEVDVIIDEIQSYNDTPSELIFDNFDTLLFGDSELGHNILGNEQQLKTYTNNDFIAFLQQNYSSDKIVFFTSGQIDFNKVIKLANKFLNKEYRNSLIKRNAPKNYTPQTIKTQRDTYQTHCIIGNRGYELNNPKRLSLFLLNNILGGPSMNSMLNLSIREKNGLAYTIESEIASYSDCGSFTIYFGCDHKNSDRCISLCKKELKKLCEQPINEKKLQHYKRQTIGQLMIASQNRESVALSMARSFLHLNTFYDLNDTSQEINKITSSQLQEVANEIFNEQQLSYLLFY